MVDAPGLGPGGSNPVEVQVLSPAQILQTLASNRRESHCALRNTRYCADVVVVRTVGQNTYVPPTSILTLIRYAVFGCKSSIAISHAHQMPVCHRVWQKRARQFSRSPPLP